MERPEAPRQLEYLKFHDQTGAKKQGFAPAPFPWFLRFPANFPEIHLKTPCWITIAQVLSFGLIEFLIHIFEMMLAHLTCLHKAKSSSR